MKADIAVYENPSEAEIGEILRRPAEERASLEELVKGIIDRVRNEGDAALIEYARTFDAVTLSQLEVPEEQIDEAEQLVSEELKCAIRRAYTNIHSFHAAQRSEEVPVESEPGVTCWRETRAIERVGIYIPGGTAPLFSTVLMLAIPAAIAGCREIVLCTPTDADGKVHPAVLYAARLSGVTRCIASGGAQAIAALAYGTESVPKVDKIFGPGNQFVTMAKQLVSVSQVAIDMPAGPSEVLVIADEHADPVIVASDLLSQAEHGRDSQVILLTTSFRVLEGVRIELDRQLSQLPRARFAAASLSHSSMVRVGCLETAFELSNRYAPEHLILNLQEPDSWLERIEHAGSVFVGPWTPESAGDYASGTNHTLPTSGWARSYSGVSLESYIKKITFQRITPAGLSALGPAIEIMASTEGLDAHRQAVTCRLQAINAQEGSKAQR